MGYDGLSGYDDDDDDDGDDHHHMIQRKYTGLYPTDSNGSTLMALSGL